MAEKTRVFFKRNPVFTKKKMLESFGHKVSSQTESNLLHYHLKKGHLLNIKRGLYASIPEGTEARDFQVDPFLVASQLTEDSVIGYHTALAFWGKLHSERNVFTYLTEKRLSSGVFRYQGLEYKAVSFPGRILEGGNKNFDVISIDRQGIEIKVTGLERTFVDVLDRAYLLSNDWEEIYRSLQSIEYIDIEKVIKYALLLGSLTTIAKVGFFIDEFKEQWIIEEKYLEELKVHALKKPVYIDKKYKEKSKYIAKWNLMVPINLITKSWEEPYEDI